MRPWDGSTDSTDGDFMIKQGFALSAALLLVGCMAGFNKNVGLDRENVPANFGEYAKLMSPLLSSEYKLKDGNKVIRPPDGASRVNSYCNVTNRQDLFDATARYCSLRGGSLRPIKGFQWCEMGDGSGPIYGYQIVPFKESCLDMQLHYITTPAPSPAFIEHVSTQFGYRTVAAELIQNHADGIEMQRRVDAHRAKQQMDAVARSALVPTMNRKGTTLCLKKGSFTYQGVVEDYSETKLKVWVQSARFDGGNNIQPGGFQPHAAWVDPLEWYPCS